MLNLAHNRLNLAQVVKRIERWRPETFILENVKGLANRRHRKFLNKLLKKLLNSISIVSHNRYLWFSNCPPLILRLRSKGYYDVKWKVPETDLCQMTWFIIPLVFLQSVR